MVKHRQRKNFIHGLEKEGVWYSKPTTVTNMKHDHFKRAFSAVEDKEFFHLGSITQKKLNAEEVKELDKGICLKEIFVAIQSLNPNKASGPG